jgi:hypothetical protein
MAEPFVTSTEPRSLSLRIEQVNSSNEAQILGMRKLYDSKGNGIVRLK